MELSGLHVNKRFLQFGRTCHPVCYRTAYAHVWTGEIRIHIYDEHASSQIPINVYRIYLDCWKYAWKLHMNVWWMCRILANKALVKRAFCKALLFTRRHPAVIRPVEARSVACLLGFAISDLSGSLSLRPSHVAPVIPDEKRWRQWRPTPFCTCKKWSSSPLRRFPHWSRKVTLYLPSWIRNCITLDWKWWKW